MNGKVLTFVALAFLMFDVVLYLVRYTFWNDWLDKGLVHAGALHLISSMLNAAGYLVVLLAVGIALWICQQRGR